MSTFMDAFDYPLPPERIAQTPVEPRDSARLLVAVDPGGAVEHRRVRDVVAYLRPGDVVVVNETRVIPARLHLRKDTGGAVEVLLLERSNTDGSWSALVRPSKRVRPGSVLVAGDDLRVEIGAVLGSPGGERRVRLLPGPGVDEWDALARHGTVPLPPYITEPLGDPERYQTVFARRPGSVAAPTAGLHLTPELMDAMLRQGAQVHAVTLTVGLDTFRPVSVGDPAAHVMHSEAYSVPAATMDACMRAAGRGGRVVAVGTTSVRALESAAATGALEGRTQLFIRDPFAFRVVDLLLTNFHLPRSTLLLLVHAFIGERWRTLYEEAHRVGYRFLSFGDAMLLSRHGTGNG